MYQRRYSRRPAYRRSNSASEAAYRRGLRAGQRRAGGYSRRPRTTYARY